MNWVKAIVIFCAFACHFFGAAQTPATYTIEPITSGTSNYLNAISLGKFSPSGDCPPKIQKNRKAAPTFLDSLGIPDSLTTAFFNQIAAQNCKSYFNTQAAFGLVRSRIDSILGSYQLPATYSLMPVALSGANPSLDYTTNRAGLWQLTYATARKNGLKINGQYDERFHASLSTIAAAKHLKFLEKMYLNHHLLVVTAFYTSVPFVNKQLQAHPNTTDEDFYHTLPLYVQEQIAYYKAWVEWDGLFKSPKNNTPNAFTKVNLNDTITFEALASFIPITTEQLALGNPVWITETYFPNMPYGLYVPKAQAKNITQQYETFLAHQAELKAQKEKELAELKKKMEQGIPDLDKYKPVTYTVKSGDVLGKIAAKHHVKVSQIKQWNNLRSDRIDIGQELTIYVPINAPMTKAVSDQKVVEPAKAPVAGKGQPTIYTVKSGESLWLIAKKFPGVSAENIMEWNGISDKIDVGQKLKIYQP